MPVVDVIVVSYNSRRHLRHCVEPLCRREDFGVIVVDNASNDGSLEAVADLPIASVALAENRGFAAGCNAGWRTGNAPFILLLNPDATIDSESLGQLVFAMDTGEQVGIVGPRIVDEHGSLEFSQRRFPRLRSTYAQALFLHRLFPKSTWTDELIRDASVYERPGSPDWVSGACMLIRRSALEEVGGLDEGFFMYCEDKDLCRRVRDAGFDVRYEPRSLCRHEGGGSAPRPSLLPVLARSRLRFAAKHQTSTVAMLERLGVAIGATTHALFGKGGWSARRAHCRALLVALTPGAHR